MDHDPVIPPRTPRPAGPDRGDSAATSGSATWAPRADGSGDLARAGVDLDPAPPVRDHPDDGPPGPGTYPLPVPPVVAAKPSAMPVVERSYPHFLRTPRARWWRGGLAIVSLVVAYLVISFALGGVAVAVDIATGRTALSDYGSGQITVTPMLFLANNLSLAALIPVAMLLQWGLFGQRPRWLSSVQGGLRWRWMGRAALILAPLWVLYVIGLYLFDSSHLGARSADAAFMVVVIVLTTPFQAAGEEYAARGLINRAAASWTERPRVALVLGAVVSSLLFMAAHGASDPWLLAYYFCFGLALAVLAWRTGGLEVPILVHAINNVLLLVPLALYGDLSNAFERGEGAGSPALLVPLGVLAVTIAVVEWWTRRTKVVTHA